MKQQAIIVDIDGTIALMKGKRGPFEWDKVGEDEPNIPIIGIIGSFVQGWIDPVLKNNPIKILLVSGREDVCRKQTEMWLDVHFPSYDALFMRAAKDNRRDVAIKAEIYYKKIEPHYDVVAVFDDRNQTVEGWRNIGLTCLQVANGDF